MRGRVVPIRKKCRIALDDSIFTHKIFMSVRKSAGGFMSSGCVSLLPNRPIGIEMGASLTSSPFATGLGIISFSRVCWNGGVVGGCN